VAVSGLDSPRCGRGRLRDAGGPDRSWHHAAAESADCLAPLDLITLQFVCMSCCEAPRRVSCLRRPGCCGRWRRWPWWIRIRQSEVTPADGPPPWPPDLQEHRALLRRIISASICPRAWPYAGFVASRTRASDHARVMVASVDGPPGQHGRSVRAVRRPRRLRLGANAHGAHSWPAPPTASTSGEQLESGRIGARTMAACPPACASRSKPSFAQLGSPPAGGRTSWAFSCPRSAGG